MKVKEILRINDELQNEGESLLRELDILKILSKFGELDLGGSYAYGTMVDRDIDVAILSEKINIEYRSKIIAELSKLSSVSRISMVDYINNPIQEKGPIIWIGLTVGFNSRVWNIDLTLAKPDSPNVHTNMDLHKEMLKLSDEKRKRILDLKYKSLSKGKKTKGKTSVEIYRKVLKI